MPAAEPAGYMDSGRSPLPRFKTGGCVAASRWARENAFEAGSRGRGRGRGGGGNVGLGIGLGVGALIVVGAIAANAAEQQRQRDAIDYCIQRYRSYDPQSMTYLSSDGYRRQCP
jgi:hypothetical protein